MNTTTLAPSPRQASASRAPRLAAALLAGLRRTGVALWRGLESHGRTTALRDLQRLHDRWETSDPHLARHLRDASAFLVAEGKRRRD